MTNVPAFSVTATVAALTLLGTLLRAKGLDSGLWFDEIVTLVESVRPPLGQVVTAFPGNNNHPFYSLLAHFSTVVLGEHAWTLRLPAFVFGVASIPILYGLATQVTTRTESLLATLLFAVAYHAVWFSQNARGYTMLLAFTLLATWLFIRLIETPRTRTTVAYGVVVALGIYTHLTMAFVAGAHALIWGWQAWRGTSRERVAHLRAAALGLGTAGVCGLLLYLPMATGVIDFFMGSPQKTAAVATSQWAIVEMLKGLRIGFGTVGVLAALALLAVGGLSYLMRSPLVAFVFVLPGALTGFAMVVLHAPIRPRFFFMLLGFGLLFLVRGAVEAGRFLQRGRVASARSDAAAPVAVCALAIASLWSLGYNYRYPKQDFEGAMAYVERHKGAGEPVATAGLARYPYEHYYRQSWTPVETRGEMTALGDAPGRVWVVYSFPEYMDSALVAWLTEACRSQQTFPGTLGGGDVVVCAAD